MRQRGLKKEGQRRKATAQLDNPMPFILPTDLPEKDELPPQDNWKRSCEHSSLTCLFTPCLFTPAAMHSIISYFICALLLEPTAIKQLLFSCHYFYFYCT